MRFRGPKGQTTAEFAFAGVWLILLMMAVLCFGFITFQKSSFDYRYPIWPMSSRADGRAWTPSRS